MGGAIFARDGAIINFTDSSIAGSSVTAGLAGTGGAGGASDGTAAGQDMFLFAGDIANVTVTGGT